MSNAMTTGEIAQHFSVPTWAARRAVDALGAQIPRAGLYRLVPRSLLGKVERELRKKGFLQTVTA